MAATISRQRRKTLLKRLKSEIGPHRSSLYWAGFYSWLQFLMRLISFYLIAQVISDLYQGKSFDSLTFLLSLLTLSALGFVAARLARPYQGLASQYARNQLKTRFFLAFEAMGGEFDASFSQADVLTVASQGIDSLDTYYQHYLSTALRTGFNCLTILVLVALVYPIGGVIFLVCLPLIPISIALMQKRSKVIMDHYWATYMDVGNLFMDNLSGMNTLYTYGADQAYEQTFRERAEAFRRSTMELLGFQLQAVGYMDGVMYLGIGLSGFAAALALANNQLSLASLIFFILIATEFFAPIREMGYGMHLVMMNTKMADRIYSFLDSVPAIQEAGEEVDLPGQIDQIQLKNLTFAYQPNQSLFEHLNLTVKRGQIFALAGESGKGKTSLAKLLQKQLEPSAGQIYLDDRDLASLSKQAVQSLVMYVSPGSYLFNQSIYDNLAMVTDLSPEQIQFWAKERGLLSFVDQLPEGLATQVGENGSRLSPGQRQQVICARALLAKRPIYIFDEMTSSIDRDNEQVLFDYIKASSQEALVFFISHKMRQVLACDQVLFIHGQQEISLGTPDQLLTSQPAFAELVRTQRELEDILHETI